MALVQRRDPGIDKPRPSKYIDLEGKIRLVPDGVFPCVQEREQGGYDPHASIAIELPATADTLMLDCYATEALKNLIKGQLQQGEEPHLSDGHEMTPAQTLRLVRLLAAITFHEDKTFVELADAWLGAKTGQSPSAAAAPSRCIVAVSRYDVVMPKCPRCEARKLRKKSKKKKSHHRR